MVAGATDGIGGGAVPAFMGASPGEDPEGYALASPVARVPTGVPVLLVHPSGDALVPISQSMAYLAAATAAGDRAVLLDPPGTGHMDLIDPRHPSWAATFDGLAEIGVRERDQTGPAYG
jgi:fermentation-respiration switch protein FrsA (DUF1100 family)